MINVLFYLISIPLISFQQKQLKLYDLVIWIAYLRQSFNQSIYFLYKQFMISVIARRQLMLNFRNLAFFSGGHHSKPFDWRDDYDLNPNYQRDPRRMGVPDPYSYSYPHEADPPQRIIPFANYDPKDLTQNFVGTFRLQSAAETNHPCPPQQVILDDIAHEYDYESEDLDFQPESFKSQHFRKRGMDWMWLVVALFPYIFVISETIYNQIVDGDQWKYQRPPPLNYPDEEDTPDTETYELFNSPEFKYLHDAGLMKDPYFQIVDGKKIYTKWSGVNQPHPVIR